MNKQEKEAQFRKEQKSGNLGIHLGRCELCGEEEVPLFRTVIYGTTSKCMKVINHCQECKKMAETVTID